MHRALTRLHEVNMNVRHIIRRMLAGLTAALVLVVGGQAFASHYDLVDIEIVPTDVRDKLLAAGIEDTQTLLAKVLTEESRAEIVKVTGMDKAAVQELAHTLELMQVSGIGPQAARLLRLSGVESIGHLAQRDAPQPLPVVLAANAKHAATGLHPDASLQAAWSY